jgi:two-component system sensor histidine kinase QseC
VRSIRRTLRLRLSGAALLLLFLAGSLLYGGVRWLLTDQFDATLHTKLRSFTTLIEQEGEEVELDFIEQAMPEFSAPAEPEYVQMWLTGRMDGWVVYRSPSLEDRDLPRLAGTEDRPVIRGLTLPDGRAGRAIGAEFVIHHYDPGTDGKGAAHLALVLAKETAALDRALLFLLVGTIAVILLLLGAGLLLGGEALTRGLRPLDELARHVGAIADPLRAPRFEREAVPVELAPLVESHNQMLARICKAFERERRTSANIAHELRTPVAELLVLAETAQRYPTDPLENARRLGELREIAAQMSTLIATLLELARMESGRVPLEIEPVDLAEMVRDCWSPLSSVADAKRQKFQPLRGRGPLVRADRVALSILLANLLRNAVDHAPVGDQIGCEVENAGTRCQLVLSNAADGLAPEDLDKLTEPFWRSSKSREDRSHTGIGLSLVRRLAELLEVELSFQLDESVFQARLSFEVC